ncbi:retrovirus-related pol polyprotein from transposon TNT 1-94, partial [Tanacetum coccineum]
DELAEVQTAFYQMEQAVEQHRLESRTFKVKMNQVLSENERLLAQAIDNDIVNTVVNLSVNNACENVNECQKYLQLETELLNKKDFIKKRLMMNFLEENSVSNQSAPSFNQLFELNELRAQSQEKDTVIMKLKEQIKSLKGNVDANNVKMDMDEIETLNIELEHRVSKLVAENEHLKQTYKQLYDSLKPARTRFGPHNTKNDLRKLKGKALVDDAVKTLSVDPTVSKMDMEPITPKLLNRRTAHSAYIKHTQEEVFVLRDIVEHVKANYTQDPLLESAFSSSLSRRQASKVHMSSSKVSSSSKCSKSNKQRNYFHTSVRLSTSASGSQPSGNTRNDKIQRSPCSNLKNKHSKKNENSDSVCIKRDNCMSSGNLCVSNTMKNVKSRVKTKPVKKLSKREVWKPTRKMFTKIGYIWTPTGRTFNLVGNACPLTRITTTTTEVPSRKPIVLETKTPKPVVTKVYSRKPRKNINTDSVSKSKVVHIVLWYLDSGCSKHMTGDRSQLTNFVSKFLGTVKFENDHVAKIMVAFRQHTCYIRNLEGVDLLTGSRGDNLYTLSLGDMMASFPICLLSKASKTKSWLWHRRLSHLNFGAINHLARHGLVRGLPKLKFEKDHLCSACALGKSTKKPHKPKSEDTNQEKLYLLHMDLCGPMRVASVNGKKYILVIVDDYSRFTWVKCLRSKDEAPAFIINFLKMIQVRLKETVCCIRTDNGTEFVNQTLREYYEKVGISHETSVALSLQQNGVVERRNHTLIEEARTMLIYAKAPLFLWAKALLHNKPPDLSYLHVFGALCYPTNDCENLGKLQPKADIGIFIGYAPMKKAFRIYNRRTRRIIETIHVDFDELTTMASKHNSLGPVLNEITPAIISSGLVPNPSSSTPFVPPSRFDWDSLFQLMFDELFNPPPYVELPTPKIIASISEAVAPEPAVSTGSPSLTTVDQDTPCCKNNSEKSSSTDVIYTVVPLDHQISKHNSKWTKDHPLENIIGELARPVSTRLQLHEQALFCYYDAFLTAV